MQSEKALLARTKLEDIVNKGRAQAAGVIASIMQTRPRDELAPTARMTFEVSNEGKAHLVTPSGADVMTEHSFGQFADRLAPKLHTYAKETLSGNDPWRRALVRDVVNTHLQNTEGRYLVRHVERQVRGVLSDTYKRIDSRPLLDSFLGAMNEVGAIAISGFATETKNSVRAILPRVIEVAGDSLVLGIHWGNSDFGAGAYQLSAFAIRLLCLNGMVGETSMKKVHLGSRLEEGSLELSDKTLDLDHRTLSSATTDVVRALLSPVALDDKLGKVAAAAAQETTFEGAWAKVGKSLTKAEKERAKAAYEGSDTLNLPEGENLWRFSNALSYIANGKDVTPDRKLELQALAGQVVGGF